MNQAKYVIVNRDQAIVFDPDLSHEMFKEQKVTSAGFCAIYAEGDEVVVETYGESVKLMISAKEGDAEIIKSSLRTRGF